MFFSAAVLGLATAAVAAPANIVPNYPPHQESQGFRLVVNVTDKALDLKPSVQGLYVNSIHVGAGLNVAGVGAKDVSNVFYQNGTASEFRFSSATTITDEATPLTPFGLSLSKNTDSETLSSAYINGGAGTPGVQISQFPEGFLFLEPETFVICNNPLQYYQGQKFLVVEQAATTISSDGQVERNLPEGCAPVRLLPECAPLEPLPAGSYASHEFALQSECYADVASINWSLYGP
ncbi:hypothetical protein TGAM01_v207088 [Trichoderma gamsii]|uniref:DUF7907 domain-containing protein n=1 Tax=Trichoderma gamsii TaxID=398673 RepID=A0A2K0T1G7_9HYPO|nr:hypothetical protein TGAM01_v207088 [Trichoderma gamsii]PNP39371.1 hypothetical protein TGAMA5MH_08789 [Trichoderma gamsii]PON24077.1 hypothetical protein TGAM01_v207088 [Trichoderma gamsii]